MDERSRKNALAFLDTLVTPGGFHFRPFSYGTLNNLRLLGMSLGQGKEAVAKLTPAQQRDEMHAYLFLQAAPLPIVAAAVRSHSAALGDGAAQPAQAFEKFMVTHVEPWLAEIPAEGIEAAFAQLAELGETGAAIVAADPPADTKKNDAPPLV